MTFADLISGHWTWWQLVRELMPLMVATVAAFFAGYERGWNQGFKRALAFGEAFAALREKPEA